LPKSRARMPLSSPYWTRIIAANHGPARRWSGLRENAAEVKQKHRMKLS
jgi:hypothetical protein